MKLIISDKLAYEKDSCTQKIVKYLKNYLSNRENCICYYQYPLYRTEFGFLPSLVLLDSEFGVVVFKILNYSNENLKKIYENYWLIDGKKERSPLLDIEEYSYSLRTDIFRPKFRLDGKINISSFIILPFFKKTSNIIESSYKAKNILFEDYESRNIFDSITKKTIEKKEWKSLLTIIQRLEPLSKGIGFAVEEPPKTIGDAIILNEQKICTFDDDQESAAIKIINGGMRIRGLAGTGKTIILTWKAAYIHYKYPDLKIVCTFYTKSLYNQIKRLITQFYRKYNPDEEPNWDNLNVLHAWGGTGKQGLYYNTCQRNKIPFMSMRGLRYTKNPFGVVLNHLLKYKINEEYDFVFVDEAQDMPLEFFSLIKRLTKSPKRITIAYDELQNTEDIQMPDFEKLFGYDKTNKPIVPLEEDIILQKSYRNHIKVLHLAVALGFDIYSKNGIIQIIENNENWKAIGYQIRKGELKPNTEVEIARLQVPLVTPQ